MNNDEWQRLEHWLSLLPRQIVETSADLTVAEGYLAYMRFRVLECAACLKRLDALLAAMPASPEKDALMGEAAALHAWRTFQAAGDFSEIGQWADESLRLTPDNRWAARTVALVYAGGAHIIKGDVKAGIDLVIDAINDQSAQEPGYKLHLMVIACLLYGYVGDLSGQMRAAQEGIRIGKAIIDAGSHEKWAIHVNWSRHHLGSVLYQRNELAEAEVVLRKVIEERYTAHVNCAIQSMLILAMICQAQNRGAEAIKLTEVASEYALEMRSTTVLPVIKSFEINLAVQQGRIADALLWLKGYTIPEKLPHLVFTYNPLATFVKAHLAAGTPEHLNQAEAILVKLHTHAERLHHTGRLMELLALKALLADVRGDQRTAMTHLEQALLLGQPEGFVRVFADLGPRMHDLLSRFHSRHVSPKYVRRVASAVSRDSLVEGFPSQAGLLEPLSSRELDVLALLMKRMSNKEIADALFISPGTVKHHTHVIFEKLEVHSRREAVMKALDLNLLGYQ
jgi:LuxR family maltose regulon positive regulatory protein